MAHVASQPGTAVNVLITDTPIVAARVGRRTLILTNDHATQVVYGRVAATGAVANQGFRINAAGGVFSISNYDGPVCGISVGGTSAVLVVEV